jgi:phasin family protein
MAATRRMLGVRSLHEAVDIQTGFTRAGFDRAVAEGTRLSDLSVRMAEDAFAPIGARLDAALDRLVRPVC